MQTIQPHLDRIKAPASTAKDHHVSKLLLENTAVSFWFVRILNIIDLFIYLLQITINQVEESEVNFVELVHSLLEDPSERNYFFQVRHPLLCFFGFGSNTR